MKSGKTILTILQKASALLLMLTLLWLTVSTPFVFAQQQKQKEAAKSCKMADNNSNTNTTEEKSEDCVKMPTEYLHQLHTHEQDFTLVVTKFRCHDADTYIAYHPEFFSPPPDATIA